MRSQKQTTGLTAQEHKLRNILFALDSYWSENKNEKTEQLQKEGKLNVSIKRYNLSIKMQSMKDTSTSRHTIATWIKFLLNKGFIVQNPTSHLMSIEGKVNKWYRKTIIMPTNDTRYFIDGKRCLDELIRLNQKLIAKRN